MGLKSIVSVEFTKVFEVGEDNRAPLGRWPILRSAGILAHSVSVFEKSEAALIFCTLRSDPLCTLPLLLSVSQGRPTLPARTLRLLCQLASGAALESDFPREPFHQGGLSWPQLSWS